MKKQNGSAPDVRVLFVFIKNIAWIAEWLRNKGDFFMCYENNFKIDSSFRFTTFGMTQYLFKAVISNKPADAVRNLFIFPAPHKKN